MPPKPPRRPHGKPTGKGRRPGGPSGPGGRAGGDGARDRGGYAPGTGKGPKGKGPKGKGQGSGPRGPRGAGQPQRSERRAAETPRGERFARHEGRADQPRRGQAEGKEFRAFRRDRPSRDEQPWDAGHRPRAGEGWLYGHHAVAAALANPARRPDRLLLTTEAADTLARDGVVLRVSPELRSNLEISALLPEGAVHQGYALKAAPLPEKHIEDVLGALAEGAPALVVVLDQVTDPRNVGAILRSAAAFSAAAVILPERHGADTTAALAKAASGALETVALVRVTNVSRTLETLKAGGFWCVGLDARADQVLSDVDLSGRVALVLGSEGAGLRRLVADTCDLRARLPISGAMESLNVSAAAAIAMYEVARGRK